jgi:pimeloyl-ACP methyl ester carboxylesterase
LTRGFIDVETGEFDEARPETVAGFQKLIPGAQFAIIKDAGHATLGKKPEEYLSVLKNFLESVERGPQ